MGRDARRSMLLNAGHRLQPTIGDRTVGLSDISKAQMAAILNEQTERFKELREHLHVVMRVLVAIVLEPEAFTYRDGQRAVEKTALDQVRSGMTLLVNEDEAGVRLTLVTQDTATTAAPEILVQAGL